MSRAGRLLASLFVGLAGAVLLASPAAAHASLVSISPADGTTLSTALGKVTLTFDENIRAPSKIVVTGPDGHRASHGSTTVVDNTVTVAVTMRPRPEDVGRYGVAFRVVSADGHPVTGESSFSYLPPGVTAAPARATRDTASSNTSHTWWFVGGGVLVVLSALFLLLPLIRTRQRA